MKFRDLTMITLGSLGTSLYFKYNKAIKNSIKKMFEEDKKKIKNVMEDMM